ncbi:MAG: kynU, partial [Acidimicrobiaceae bacterium]|nr:kynU [Acidimicrobiaceae bacterium]
MTTREECQTLDLEDELAPLRNEFLLNYDEIYLDGNSLGPVSRNVSSRVNDVVDHQWGKKLVRGWNDAGWMALPTRLGDRIAILIGAHSGEVVVADTLTIALAKLIGGALKLRPDRHVIVTDVDNFHSDLYIAHAMAARGERAITVKTVDRGSLEESLNDDVALVM